MFDLGHSYGARLNLWNFYKQSGPTGLRILEWFRGAQNISSSRNTFPNSLNLVDRAVEVELKFGSHGSPLGEAGILAHQLEIFR